MAAPREICLAAVRRHFASKTEKVSLTYPSTTIVETAGLVVPDVSRELLSRLRYH